MGQPNPWPCLHATVPDPCIVLVIINSAPAANNAHRVLSINDAKHVAVD